MLYRNDLIECDWVCREIGFRVPVVVDLYQHPHSIQFFAGLNKWAVTVSRTK